MSDTDSMMNSFRGPTPPPALDQTVMQAATQKAAALGKDQRPRLSGEAEKSYSKRPKTEQTAMSDNIVFPCPACGTKYSVSPHHAGKKTTCKKCSAQVTVPTPQVANPTIVGGTRTIRRADIDAGASSREDAVEGGNKAEVEMNGGASVLRKEETVIGAPPMHATSVGTRAPARRAATTAKQSAPVPKGRPAPYGAPGMPAKKNNTPMLLGIGGGALGLILLIVIIVAASGGPDTTTNSNTVAGDGKGTKEDPDQKLLAEHRTAMKSVEALTFVEVREFYVQADERKDKADWKGMRDLWAPQLARRAESGGSPEDLAEIALLLDNAKYAEGHMMLESAWQALKNAKPKSKATREVVDKNGRKTLLPNPKFVDIVTRLGWKSYKRPVQMDDCYALEVEGASEYNMAYGDIDQTFHDVELYPPELVEQLTTLEKQAIAGYNVLMTADKDGWAVKSRKAWIRFKLSQDSKAKVDRVKGKRSFSPTAMGRETEKFDSIWTYAYGPSIMVFVEKPIGQDDLDEAFLETLESKKALLRDLFDWFEKRLIDKYNLQRVKPKDDAAQAQLEGWPMEVIVLKDFPTFQKHYEEVNPGQTVPPGARAYYSPWEGVVMTYDDRADMSADTQWFNESVLIHETFHMLSDFYAADPMFTKDEMQLRPSYSSILVQEGLTDSVAGFKREGTGEDLKYEFMQLNHLRLRDFKAIYEMLGKKELYRIRDTLECRHYGQCDQKATERMKTEKFNVNPLWLAQIRRGMFYATSCQISYFFEYYKDGSKFPYRDKWWEFLGDDYKGKNKLNGWDDNSAITKFKTVFGIKTDADWDELEKNFIEYTLDLDAEDVGKGGTDLEEKKEKKEDESIMPGIPPMPGFGQDGSQMPALPGREREEELEEALVGERDA